jgi:hypothetical protein
MLRIITYDGEKSTATKFGFSLSRELPKNVEEYDGDVIIRWGNSLRAYNKYGMGQDYKCCLNSRMAIRENCSKHTATQKLSEVVHTPKLFMSFVPRGITSVVRPIEHIAGVGFSIKDGPFPIEPGQYATEYMGLRPNTDDKECRVWFCGNRTLVGKRARSANKAPRPCRSEWGYEFNHHFHDSLRDDAIIAAKHMNLDMGAADVLWIGGVAYFLELNSAPAIDHWRVEEWFRKSIIETAKERFGDKART